MTGSRAKVGGYANGTLAHGAEPIIQIPRVFIVSNVRLVQEALVLYLSQEKRVEVVGAGEPSPSVAAAFLHARVDIALLDMSVFSAIDTARRFVALASPAKVVAFSVAEADSDVLACAESGMAGFVTRNSTIEDLVTATENAMRGELRCSPHIAGRLFDRLAQLGARLAPDAEPPLLTKREREIGGLIVQGLSNKAIAEELRIGTATVKNHVHSILDKLHVRRRGEAAVRLRDRPG
jgi:DNA-binding NarL/FixJ family response regulator